jgi:hypothetical protein
VIEAANCFAKADGKLATPTIVTDRHTWWRKYSARTIAPAASSIAADLDHLSATDPELRHALRGEVTSAIRLAIDLQGDCVPFSPFTDLVMTALMRCALEGSAAAAMVMGNVIKSCGFDHEWGPMLTESWLSFKPPEDLKRLDSSAAQRLADTVDDAYEVEFDGEWEGA